MTIYFKYFTFLLATMLFIGCQNDDPSNSSLTRSEDNGALYTIKDGKISSPQWLAKAVMEVAQQREPSEATGKHYYPWVFLYNYEGASYFCVCDMLSSNSLSATTFYTAEGDIIEPYSELWKKFHEDGLLPKDVILIWDASGLYLEKSKAVSETRAVNTSVFTPRGSVVSNAFINGETLSSDQKRL